MGTVAYYRSPQWELIQLTDKPLVYQEHNHVSIYTIGFVLAGVVTLVCEKQAVAVAPNHFFLIKPYQMHGLLLPATYDLVVVCLDKTLVAAQDSNSLRQLLSCRLGPIVLPDLLLNRAVAALYRCEPGRELDRAMLASADQLRQKPEQNSSVQSLAADVYCSKYHYIKRFKQNMGMTPHQFQLQNKVRKAQRLLESGKSLTGIAADLGFYDQSHFIKCFKQIVGLTPSAYKQAFQCWPDGGST